MCQKEGLPRTILKNRFETAPVPLSTPLPCPSRFLHSPFTKCGENPGERSLKTKVMQQNAADKGTKKAIYFQNFRKSKLHPQKNSTTHEKVVEKNAIHATSRLQPVWMNGTPPIRHVGAAILSPATFRIQPRAVERNHPPDMSSRPSENERRDLLK